MKKANANIERLVEQIKKVQKSEKALATGPYDYEYTVSVLKDDKLKGIKELRKVWRTYVKELKAKENFNRKREEIINNNIHWVEKVEKVLSEQLHIRKQGTDSSEFEKVSYEYDDDKKLLVYYEDSLISIIRILPYIDTYSGYGHYSTSSDGFYLEYKGDVDYDNNIEYTTYGRNRNAGQKDIRYKKINDASVKKCVEKIFIKIDGIISDARRKEEQKKITANFSEFAKEVFKEDFRKGVKCLTPYDKNRVYTDTYVKTYNGKEVVIYAYKNNNGEERVGIDINGSATKEELKNIVAFFSNNNQ